MSKPFDKQHVFDFRPRFTEKDDQLIRVLADRAGIPPAVLIRHIVKRAIDGNPVQALSELRDIQLEH